MRATLPKQVRVCPLGLVSQIATSEARRDVVPLVVITDGAGDLQFANAGPHSAPPSERCGSRKLRMQGSARSGVGPCFARPAGKRAPAPTRFVGSGPRSPADRA